MPDLLNITVCVPRLAGFRVHIVEGVADYAAEAGNWVTRIQENLDDMTLPGEGDGIIVAILNPATVEAVSALPVPVVNVAGVVREAPFPMVIGDFRAWGLQAAEHLLERGFTRFAFAGSPGSWFSDLRQEGFVDRVTDAGHPCTTLGPTRRGWHEQIEDLQAWVATLPTPVGLAAQNDTWAHAVLEAARLIGRRVPDDVAIVGMEDDPIYARICTPRLSSVRTNTRRRGYEAAALLDRLIAGQAPPAEPILVEPGGVEVRGSSDTLAVEDEDVIAAMRFIRASAGECIDVEDILEQVPISRRSLELKFARDLDCTPHEAIWEAHMRRACSLLVETDLTILDVALRSGFRSPSALSTLFKRRTGLTPREYRRRHRNRYHTG
jgi:LacI family transcriptional regulator